MKLKIFTLIIVSITAIALIMVISCSRKENPLSVDPGASDTEPITNPPRPDGIDVLPAYGQELDPKDSPIYITFDRYMLDSTLNTENIMIHKVTPYNDIEVDLIIEYFPGPHFVKISAEDFEFPYNSAFVLTLTNGIMDRAGIPLDGNGNGVADTGQLDYLRTTFYTDSGWVDLPDFVSPRIDQNSIYPPSDTSILGMTYDDFRISVGFTGGDVQYDLLTTDILRVSSLGRVNFGAPETTFVPNLVKVEARDSVSVTYRLLSEADTLRLTRADRYMVEFVTSAVTDTAGNPLVWGEEAPDDSVASYFFGFIMEPEADDDIDPPHFSSFNVSYFNDSWRAIVSFDEAMDTSSFNAENISFFDQDKVRLDGNFIKETGYYGFAFYPRQRTKEPVYYYIDRAVTDSTGNMLDGNFNGLGGEPEDYATNLLIGP